MSMTLLFMPPVAGAEGAGNPVLQEIPCCGGGSACCTKGAFEEQPEASNSETGDHEQASCFVSVSRELCVSLKGGFLSGRSGCFKVPRITLMP